MYIPFHNFGSNSKTRVTSHISSKSTRDTSTHDMPGTTRTTGCDLEDKQMFGLWDTYVPLATCKPKQLWALPKVAKNGLTSSWTTIAKNYPMLSLLLDESKGLIPKQAKLTDQLMRWLAEHKMTWSYKDAEQSCTCLRCMLQSMLAHKRNNNGQAPVRHEILQPLLDKMHCEIPPKAARTESAIAPAGAIEDQDLRIVENPIKRTKKIDLIDVEESSDDDNLMLAIYGGAKQKSHVHFAYVPCRVPVPGDVAHVPQAVQDQALAPGYNYKIPASLPNAFTHFTSLRNHSVNTKFAPKNNLMDIELEKNRSVCGINGSFCPPLRRETCRAIRCINSGNGSDAARFCQT